MDLAVHRPKHGRDNFGDAAGYVGCGEEVGWLYLSHKQVTAIIGNSPNATFLKQHLLEQGILAPPKQGGFVVQRKIFTGGKGNQNYAWVCAFNSSILAS
jgi:hypothetical protein